MTIREDVQKAQAEQDAADAHVDVVMLHIQTMYPVEWRGLTATARRSIRTIMRQDFLLRVKNLSE